jgi:hypothetical protein
MTVMSGNAASNSQFKRRDSTMSLLDPLTWNFDFFLLRDGNDSRTKKMRKERIVLSGVYLATFVLSAFWLTLVTNYVPEPYLVTYLSIYQLSCSLGYMN